MIKAAKLVLVDPDDNYLMMYRSDHPRFGVDPDLPGGTVEAGETFEEAVVREVVEEAGVPIPAKSLQQVYVGGDYSRPGLEYALYVARIDQRPHIRLSWEHESYEWLKRADFLAKAHSANDTYMHMVAEVMDTFTP